MRWLLWLSASLVAAGCAHDSGHPRPSTTRPMSVTLTRPTTRATLALDEILPRPILPSPTTIPATEPSLDAVQLYARARDAHLRGDRSTEITLLQQAIVKDPNSFELTYALGLANTGSASGNDAAIRQFQRAAQIRPDDLQVQLQLGRQFLFRGRLEDAILHLRLALQTSGYESDGENAALVNLFLARALQQEGYDLAAIGQYESLMHRMDGRFSFYGHPELYYITAHPDMIYLPAGELYEKVGRNDDALRVYGLAAQREPRNFSYRAQIVRTLLRMKQFEDAKTRAADLVSEHGARPESLDLLKLVYKEMGRENLVIDELRELLKRRPADRSITFALADALWSAGREKDAEALLRREIARTNWELPAVGRLFDLYQSRGHTSDALRLVIECLPHRPEALEELEALWAMLLRGSTGAARIRLALVQALPVAPGAEASRSFWSARLASALGRRALARQLLEASISAKPALQPAWEDLMEAYLYRLDLPEAQRIDAARKLVERARAEKLPAVADMVQGLLLFKQSQFDEAAAAFDAVMSRARSPRLAYLKAMASARGTGRDNLADSLWKITASWPTYDPAYESLFQLYEAQRDIRQLERVLRAWLMACPSSVGVRRRQAEILLAQRRAGDAQAIAVDLFRQHDDDVRVIALLRQVYLAQQDDAGFLARMEEQRAKRPDNPVLVGRLSEIYRARKQTADAIRVLNAMRSAVADDSDLLYQLADLYAQIDQKKTAEDVLLQSLKLDPNSAAANNYLGYMWADQDRNLSEAESMIRLAIAAEPDNSAFLDSLGWVLYKRGQYTEAERHLARAAENMDEPDPVVLDHLGDVRYRLDRKEDAAKAWNGAMQRLAGVTADRVEYTKLRAQLKQKLEQQKAGRPVDVAPVWK